MAPDTALADRGVPPETDRVAVAFARVLRGAGLDVPVGATITYARALDAVGLDRRDETYWAGRATLLRGPEDASSYDRAFRAFWDRTSAAVDANAATATDLVLAFDDLGGQEPEDDPPGAANDDEDVPVVTVRWSPADVLRHRDRVLALSSVGSLRNDLGVGTHVVPDDFIALDQPPASVHDDERGHIVPGFGMSWRSRVLKAWVGATDGTVVDGGVYWQSNGPRFETPAEIRYVGGFASVIGMTIGSECSVANELGLDYAAVCVVDNLANGLDVRPLTPDEFAAGKAANRDRVLAILAAVVPVLAA